MYARNSLILFTGNIFGVVGVIGAADVIERMPFAQLEFCSSFLISFSFLGILLFSKGF